MKKVLFPCILFLFNLSIFYGQGLGLPIWLFSDNNGGDIVLNDWRSDPPDISTISNPDLISIGGTGIAFDECGEIAFYVMHDGSSAENRLFIYDKMGNPLLNSTTPNGPGLNSMSLDGEIQVVKVPEFEDEWYIIYKRWRQAFGSPDSDGNYMPWNILFSRVRYDGANLTVLYRDLKLTDDNGVQWTYVDGKAVSRTGPVPNSHYLYVHRRALNSTVMEGHRYIITADTISFDKPTGTVNVDWYSLGALGSLIELSPSEDRVAMVNRNASNNKSDVVIFDTNPFNNGAANHEIITGNDLMIQPDGVNIFAPTSIDDASLLPGLGWLKNFDRKLSKIEFSPNGRYLYIGGGGFVTVTSSNVNYLAQVDLNSAYPYDVRLQVEEVPFGFDPTDGTGCPTSNAACSGSIAYVSDIQAAPNGNLYFRKRNSSKLWVIPDPNSPMPQMITPGVIDLAIPGEPNIETGYIIGRIPDQIDGFEYLDPDIVTFDVVVRKEPCQGNCIQYNLELQIAGDTVETFDVEGCAANSFLDTITFCIDINEDYDLVEVGGISYTDAIIGGVIQYPNGGDWFDFTPPVDTNVVDLGIDTTLCPGESIVLDAGSNFAEYDWSTGATTQTITVNSVGTYSVITTSIHGCLTGDTINVSVRGTLPAPDLGPDIAVCSIFNETLDAGSGYLSYSWNTGATTQSITVTTLGTYTVNVTDSCGIILTDAIEILDGTEAPIDLGEDSTFCGAVSLTIDAGSDYQTYNWNTGGTGQSISVTAPGSYFVEGTSAAGCTSVDTIIITSITPSPPVDLGPDISVCETISETLDAGPDYLSYEWSTGATTQSISVTALGTYSVSVTDSCGNLYTDELEIISAIPSPVDLGEDTTFCGAVSITLNAGAQFSSYSWNTGATSQTINVTSPGTYSVTATTAVGCVSSDEIVIDNVTPGAAPDLGPDLSQCETFSEVLDAGSGYLSYDWSTGATTQSITVSSLGTYSVTVVDSCGDSYSDEIEMLNGEPADVDLGEDTIFCGAVSITLDAGTQFATFAWNTGATTQTINVTSPGTYSVTATTAIGCVSSDEIIIENVTPGAAPDLGPDIAQCDVFTEILDAGSGYLSYDWSTGATSQSIIVSALGTYSVTVEDSCGTLFTDEIELLDGTLPPVDLGPDTLFCGAVSLTLDIGADFETFSWSTGATTQSINVTSPGVYFANAVTPLGCTSADTIIVENVQPSAPPNLGLDSAACGVFNILLDAGPGYVAYNWSDGTTNQTTTATVIGVYYVEVVDSCGTLMTDTFEVLDGAGALEIEDFLTDETVCFSEPLLLDGNIPSIETWEWVSGGQVLGNQSTLALNPTSQIEIILNIGNACGTASDTATIFVNELPTAIISGGDTICGPGGSVPITVDFLTGNAPYEISYSDGSNVEVISNIMSDPYIINETDAGTYTLVSISDINCTGAATGSAMVAISDISFDYSMDFDPCIDEEAIITMANVQGGFGPYTYAVDNEPFTSNPTVVVGNGSHTLTVMDASGCTESISGINVQSSVNFSVEITANGSTTGNTVCLGDTIQLGLQLNPAVPVSVEWFNSSNSLDCIYCPDPIAIPYTSTTYEVLVIDDNGCERMDTIYIPVINPYDLHLPTAFTPNGDTHNDYFYVLGGPKITLIKAFKIYNRWGELLFERYDVPPFDPMFGWDGKQGGEPVEMDTYVYFVEVEINNGFTFSDQGHISVIY